MEPVTLRGFAERFAAMAALVALTYNPTGWSYLHWLAQGLSAITPLKVLAGLLLAGGWGFVGHATWRSLGGIGVAFAAALTGAFLWLLVSWGWLSLSNHTALAWLLLAIISLLLATGLYWSHIRRRITGQIDVDETAHH